MESRAALDLVTLMPARFLSCADLSETQNVDSIISRAQTPLRSLAYQALREGLRCRDAFGEHRIAFPIRELPAHELRERLRLNAERARRRLDAFGHHFERGGVEWPKHERRRPAVDAALKAYLAHLGR